MAFAPTGSSIVTVVFTLSGSGWRTICAFGMEVINLEMDLWKNVRTNLTCHSDQNAVSHCPVALVRHHLRLIWIHHTLRELRLMFQQIDNFKTSLVIGLPNNTTLSLCYRNIFCVNFLLLELFKKNKFFVWLHLLVSLRYVGIQNLSRQSLHNSLCIFQHSHSLKFGSPCMNRPLY